MMTGWEGTPGERCNAPRKEGSPPLVCPWPPVSGRARAVIVPTLQRVWRPGQGQGQNGRSASPAAPGCLASAGEPATCRTDSDAQSQTARGKVGLPALSSRSEGHGRVSHAVKVDPGASPAPQQGWCACSVGRTPQGGLAPRRHAPPAPLNLRGGGRWWG